MPRAADGRGAAMVTDRPAAARQAGAGREREGVAWAEGGRGGGMGGVTQGVKETLRCDCSYNLARCTNNTQHSS